ncbi:MAG TPA: VWA domain-containing protein, partial [Sandaracinaceae bacterium LLY-WYZ-13_1]|nr:VWA domain-containing protein [Sandaracinaceae bacterium LLY-WYZ-13_1]
PAAPAPRRSGRGRAAGARARVAQPSPRPSAAPLPQNGVLASTFVGGRGAQARLEDLLDRGVAVGGEQVRLEAFDELGRLPYPVPAEEAVGLHAELERARLREAGERVHLQIALMARRGERPPRPRMDVRLVLDRSGSMHGDKWTHAIAAAHQLVNRLEAGDTFGLISYSDEASVDLAPARIGDRRAAHRAIDDLRPGGGTNLEAALAAARAHAPRRRAMNDVLLTVVVSDGVANVGQTNPQALGGMARTLFDERGVLTTSVGLGTDFDEDTMIALAREGSGSYHFVRRATDIGEILTDELEERAQAVAQALRLRVELGEGVVATRVYGSRLLDEEEQARVRRTEVATDARLARELGITRDRQRDEDRGLRIHLPSFRRGDQHVVLMELEVPPGTERARIARVSLDYKDLLSRGNRSAHADVEAERTDDPEAATASTRRPVKRTVLAFQAGDALQSAATHLERGDLSGARTLLAERQRLLSTASRLWNDRALAEDASLLERYDRVLAHAWPSWDSHSRRTMVMAMSFYGDRRMR